MYKKICKYCGKEIITNRKYKKFCNQECYWKYLRGKERGGKVEIRCAYCGKLFKDFRYKIKRGKRFCSTECGQLGKRKRKRTYLVCKYCGKGFYPGNLKRKFCSKECAAKFRRGVYPECLRNSISEEKRREMGINSQIKQGKNKKPNRYEQELYDVLDQMLIIYEKQKPLEKITIADAFIPDTKTVIYVDGKYWHSLPKVKERDKRITETLKKKGYKVIRYTV